MPASLLTPPATEPLSLADAKAFLRIDHDHDDAIISALIASARGQVEALTRSALMTQVWRLVLDAWPCEGRITPRFGPLRAVNAARVYDAAGHASSIDTGRFVVDAASGVIVSPGWSLPVPGRARAGIELDIAIGFGPTAADVPDVLRHAIRVLVAHWYDNRGLAAIGASVAMLPGSVSAMIANYRVVSL